MRHQCQYSLTLICPTINENTELVASRNMFLTPKMSWEFCQPRCNLFVNTNRENLDGKYLLDKLKISRPSFTRRLRVLRKCKVIVEKGWTGVGVIVGGKSYYTSSFCKDLLQECARVSFEETLLYYGAFIGLLGNLIGYLFPSLLCVIIKSKGEQVIMDPSPCRFTRERRSTRKSNVIRSLCCATETFVELDSKEKPVVAIKIRHATLILTEEIKH